MFIIIISGIPPPRGQLIYYRSMLGSLDNLSDASGRSDDGGR